MNNQLSLFHGIRSILVVMILIACVAACEDDPVVQQRTVYDVTYSLNVSGDSSVDQVSYWGAGQMNTTMNPTDGWTVSIPVGDGNRVSAAADGTVENGSIILLMIVAPEEGSSTMRRDECTEAEGTPTVCSLSTGEVDLK